MPKRCAAFLSILWLALQGGAISLIAQRPPVEHVPEIPNHEEEQERVPGEANEHIVREVIKAPKLDGSGILMSPAQWEAFVRANSKETKPPATLHWEKTLDSSGRASWSARPQGGTSAKMELNAVEESLKQGNVFINEGPLPNTKEWRDLNSKYPGQMIFHELESANRGREAIGAAVHLGDRPIDPAKVKIFNALPHETELEAHFQEQTRMGVGGTLEYWKNLHQEISNKFKATLPHRATREEVLEEIHHGTSDVLILYAHFDGEHLYMPGAKGGTISVEELAQLDRTKDPNVRERVVILVACNAGARTQEHPRSLTSVLLEKGLARTVFGTDHPFDSREIPSLLKQLANGIPLRKATGLQELSAKPGQRRSFLQQYVEVRPPVLNGEQQEPGE